MTEPVDRAGRYPFGRPATRRPARAAVVVAELFVLGVYPSALHVRWTRPDGKVVGALAVDDEPEVFWDGADADRRIADWRDAVGWSEAWGRVGPAGGNGSSGRVVVDKVLRPLGTRPEATFFSDCVPIYFVKKGPGSQGDRIRSVYDEFAAQAAGGLRPADLPDRPTPARLVERAVEHERDTLLDQITRSGAPRIVTLGQEAADVLAGITGSGRVQLETGPTYGEPVALVIGDRTVEWIPITHPGNRTTRWVARHDEWAGKA